MRSAMHTTVLVVAVAAFGAPDLWAQSSRLRLSSSVAGAVGDGASTVAASVAAGFRLSRHAGVEIELVRVRGHELERDSRIVPLLFPPIPLARSAGRAHTTALLSSLVLEFEAGRLRPYALFGGGLARVRLDSPSGSGQVSLLNDGNVVIGDSSPRDSTGDLALTTGGGVDLRVWKGLFAGVDIRYLRISADDLMLRDSHLDLSRIGTRVTWRF